MDSICHSTSRTLADAENRSFTPTGGGIFANAKTNKTINIGAHLVVGGLAILLTFFVVFIVVAIVFNRRIVRAPTALSQDPALPWFRHLAAISTASGLIMVRSLFRVVEYAHGNAGFLQRHESFLYIFDATLMFGTMLIFNVAHPSEVKAMLRGGKALNS